MVRVSKKKKMTRLLEELLSIIEDNIEGFEIINYILPAVSIRWKCIFPQFPEGSAILLEYKRIENPTTRRTKKQMILWLSNAHSLVETTLSLLDQLDDEEYESMGIQLLQGIPPPLSVISNLKKYKSCKEIITIHEYAVECEKCSYLDCKRACAFYIRKILEASMKKWALKNNIPLDTGGNPTGLKSILRSARIELGESFYKHITDEKFLMEETIHDDHNPSIQTLKHAIDIVFRTIDKLEIFETSE